MDKILQWAFFRSICLSYPVDFLIMTLYFQGFLKLWIYEYNLINVRLNIAR